MNFDALHLHPATHAPLRDLNRLALRSWPLPAPDAASDKEGRGHVLIVAGSREIPGAALLAATAALRAGAGKLTVATTESVAPGLALAIPEARVVAMPETAAGGMFASGITLLEPCLDCVSAALLGPGLLDAPRSCELVGALLEKLEHASVVLDALAMSVLHDRERLARPVLVTPHAGEMAHLTGRSKNDVLDNACELARGLARGKNVVVALKGATTFIVSAQGTLDWSHRAAIPGLATSGSGDVLAGIMAGLAARGAGLEQAAAWGVVTHALAGRKLAQRNGPLGFLARELLAEIPAVLWEMSAEGHLGGSGARVGAPVPDVPERGNNIAVWPVAPARPTLTAS